MENNTNKYSINLDKNEIDNTVSETMEFFDNIQKDKEYRKKIRENKSDKHKELTNKFRNILDEIDNI